MIVGFESRRAQHAHPTRGLNGRRRNSRCFYHAARPGAGEAPSQIIQLEIIFLPLQKKGSLPEIDDAPRRMVLQDYRPDEKGAGVGGVLGS